MRKSFTVLIIIICLVLIPVSCKKSSNNSNNEPTPDSSTKKDGEVGGSAIVITEKDSTGADFNLESLKGKVILLSFSAYWCGPCQSEAKELPAIYNKYKAQGLEIVQCLFQDVDGSVATEATLQKWMQEFGINFTMISDADQSSVRAYKVQGIPHNVIIDKNFIVRKIEAGFPGAAALSAEIEKYL